ncbi:endonuclease/exonuclease/phosphatase family protein [Pedobacter suwonensis]|uniref:endonuclease/exonuclease/phosphatase family protein n=2 Tax=Pedobacter suwonensis TaxID=332999 RepID=UPI0025CB9570|nr:endonuclease/exonuclease/phosphatase family protein [uncultured Pedobacter sp.]
MKLYSFLILSICFLGACSPKINQQVESERNKVLRVMSYNIHHCNPPSKAREGVIDVDAIVKAIAQQKPDFVALQEVDVNTKRSGNINQAVLLATKLKMNFYFGKAIDHDGGDYGVAILSRFPLSAQQTLMLPKNNDAKAEQRVLAIATAEIAKGVFIRFASTHLDAQRSEENRILQAKELNRLTAKETLPLILAGDLNADPGSESIRIFDTNFTRTCSDCSFTIPSINPRKTIDHIGFKTGNPFKVVSHEVVSERYASDHLPVVAVLQLEK